MKFVYIFVVFAALAASSLAQIWHINPANGHLYTTLNSTSWEHAQHLAEDLGGDLVTINDQDENDWLENWLLSTTAESVDRGWIGLFQVPGSPEPEDGWIWVSGETSEYRHWNPITDEPNNSGGGENWGQFFIRTHALDQLTGYWNDCPESTNDLPIAIVEVVPEPATLAILGLGATVVARRRKR